LGKIQPLYDTPGLASSIQNLEVTPGQRLKLLSQYFYMNDEHFVPTVCGPSTREGVLKMVLKVVGKTAIRNSVIPTFFETCPVTDSPACIAFLAAKPVIIMIDAGLDYPTLSSATKLPSTLLDIVFAYHQVRLLRIPEPLITFLSRTDVTFAFESRHGILTLASFGIPLNSCFETPPGSLFRLPPCTRFDAHLTPSGFGHIIHRLFHIYTFFMSIFHLYAHKAPEHSPPDGPAIISWMDPLKKEKQFEFVDHLLGSSFMCSCDF
jgi:hypothetical protein